MRRFLVTLSLLFLVTFIQVPAGGADPAKPVQVPGFSTSENDIAWGLASYGSGVYVVGTTDGDLHNRQKVAGDAFIRKYDANKRVLWTRQFGTAQVDNAWGAATDAGGNVYVVGATEGALERASYGGSDGFVRKYSANGKILWRRQFGTKNQEYMGSIAVSGDSLYVVGHRLDEVTGKAVALVERLDASGHEVWSRTFGTLDYNYATAVATDREANAYVAGLGPVSSPTLTESDITIRKYRPDRTLAWAKRLDYGKVENAFGLAGLDSSVYLAGHYTYHGDPDNRDVRVVKFNTDGSRLWDKRFDLGGNDYLYSIDARGGGVVFCGETVTPTGDSDGYVIKLTPKGKKIWQTRLATPEYDSAGAVISTRTGVYATGETRGTLGSSRHGEIDTYLTRLRNKVWRSRLDGSVKVMGSQMVLEPVLETLICPQHVLILNYPDGVNDETSSVSLNCPLDLFRRSGSKLLFWTPTQRDYRRGQRVSFF